jgi:hypothetical protein
MSFISSDWVLMAWFDPFADHLVPAPRLIRTIKLMCLTRRHVYKVAKEASWLAGAAMLGVLLSLLRLGRTVTKPSSISTRGIYESRGRLSGNSQCRKPPEYHRKQYPLASACHHPSKAARMPSWLRHGFDPGKYAVWSRLHVGRVRRRRFTNDPRREPCPPPLPSSCSSST